MGNDTGRTVANTQERVMNDSHASPAGATATDPVNRAGELTPEQLAAQWEEAAPPAAGGIANTAACLVVLVIGVLTLVLAAGLGLGSPSQPQPGLWPFAVGAVITVLSLVQLVVGRHGGDGEKFSRLSWLVAGGAASLAVVVVLLPVIGFEIPSFLLCLLWMKVLGGESWRSAILYSLIVVVAAYAVFVLALRTTIPHLF